jgi:hypothetical protein
MATDEKKAPMADPSSEVEAHGSDSNQEVDVINILGYKPELRRNRSMFTLLFQSLAIAAVRHVFCCCRCRHSGCLGVSGGIGKGGDADRAVYRWRIRYHSDLEDL